MHGHLNVKCISDCGVRESRLSESRTILGGVN